MKFLQMLKKIFYIFFIIFFVTSCADTFDSVKRGLTGAKRSSADEFLIKKKDPLILPPDYENLPNPDESKVIAEEDSIFEKSLENVVEEESVSAGSVENSILRKIRSK
tara:strand:- start:267 stop:590 length:324 start_codon:yes stop_codon:yes gene_type:complete